MKNNATWEDFENKHFVNQFKYWFMEAKKNFITAERKTLKWNLALVEHRKKLSPAIIYRKEKVSPENDNRTIIELKISLNDTQLRTERSTKKANKKFPRYWEFSKKTFYQRKWEKKTKTDTLDTKQKKHNRKYKWT